DVLHLALEHTGLQRRTDRDDLVRVHALVRLLAAGQLLDQVGDRRHTGGTTDQHDVVDVADRDARVPQHVVERLAGALQQVRGDLLELGAGQRLVQEQRVLVRVHGDVGQVDVGRG